MSLPEKSEIDEMNDSLELLNFLPDQKEGYVTSLEDGICTLVLMGEFCTLGTHPKFILEWNCCKQDLIYLDGITE